MDERDYKAMNRELNQPLQQCSVRRSFIIHFLDWLVKKDIMISESADGYIFRSSQIGGRKYTTSELYDWYESENFA